MWFLWFLFINNSDIPESYLYHDEIHLNKAGFFWFIENFVSCFQKSFWHGENVCIERNLQIANSGTMATSALFVTNPSRIHAGDTQDVNVNINDGDILYNVTVTGFEPTTT